MRLREDLADPELRRLAGGARSLPSVPDLYNRINAELGSNDPSPARIGQIIAQDPAMSLEILQIVNSSFFGLRREVTDIGQATSLLGLDTISSLVLGAGVFSKGPADPVSAAMVGHVYESSLEIASVSKRIAQAAGADRRVVEEAYLAGLIQDVGILALATNWPSRWRQVDRSKMELSERTIFGTTHAAFGAYIASLWGLPDSLVEAIRTGVPDGSGEVVDQRGPRRAHSTRDDRRARRSAPRHDPASRGDRPQRDHAAAGGSILTATQIQRLRAFANTVGVPDRYTVLI